jgi:hypothetical protein
MTNKQPSTFDVRAEMARTLDTLFQPGDIFELRIITANKYGATISGYYDYDHREQLIKDALRYDGKAPAVYISLNPAKPALQARAANRCKELGRNDPTTGDADILTRRWFPIDIDPIRPSGISATDTEHEAAIKTARQIRAWLSQQGWPRPIMADSGNGAHLLYQVDLPNDDASRDLIKSCLQSLAKKFNNDQVKIDESIFNAARIWKFYGSLACKGDNVPERPHRRAHLIEIPNQ